MKVLLTNSFKRTAKKLHRNQLAALKAAIEQIQNNPLEGELKVGDLAGIRVYKFRMLNQLILLAYNYSSQSNELQLLSFVSHEKFYENLKNQISS